MRRRQNVTGAAAAAAEIAAVLGRGKVFLHPYTLGTSGAASLLLLLLCTLIFPL